jgi:BlaI family transcriptional regulator, penicillinase repressor
MEKLTLQEEQAMQALWEIQAGNVKAIQEAINDSNLPYTTLASTVKNLERKGFVTASKLGNTYIYEAAIPEAQYKKKHLQHFINDYFDNSYKNMVSFFVKEKKLSAKDLQEIIKQIENNK